MGAVMSTLGLVLQGIGQITQGIQANRAEQFNASVARANAQAIRQSADLDITRQRKAARRLKSAQIAGYAKAGVKLEGSPLEVLLDSASEAELDMMITDYNARVGMAQQEAQAKQYQRAGKTALMQGLFAGGKTLLTTAVGQGWFQKKPQYATVGGFGKVRIAPPNYYKR